MKYTPLALLTKFLRDVQVSRGAEVESCPSCAGKGYRVTEELENYHKREYRTEYRDCEQCGGFGRVVRLKYEIQGSAPGPKYTVRAVLAEEFLPGSPENVQLHIAGEFFEHATTRDIKE